MALATFYDISLIFITLCFSTWIVLPWAFYDKLPTDGPEISILRRAQIYLFMAGMFFLGYIVLRVLYGISPLNLAIGLFVPLIKDSLYLFALAMMSVGLVYAARVVNHVSRIGQEEKDLLNIPFFLVVGFGEFVTSLMLGAVVRNLYTSTGIIAVEDAIFVIIFVTVFLLNAVGIKWRDHIYRLFSSWKDARGIFAVAMMATPYLLLYALLFLHIIHVVR